MSHTLMGLQNEPLAPFPTMPHPSSMNPSFLPPSGPEQSPQLSTLTTGCPLQLSLTLLLTLLCLDPSLMCLCSECLDLLHMCTSRRTRGLDCHLTWRSASLLGILLSTRDGSSTTPPVANLCCLTEQTLMRGCVLGLLAIWSIKLFSLLLLVLLAIWSIKLFSLLLLVLLVLPALPRRLLGCLKSQMCHNRWEVFLVVVLTHLLPKLTMLLLLVILMKSSLPLLS